jgi:hypothetical protein
MEEVWLIMTPDRQPLLPRRHALQSRSRMSSSHGSRRRRPRHQDPVHHAPVRRGAQGRRGEVAEGHYDAERRRVVSGPGAWVDGGPWGFGEREGQEGV